MEYFISPKVQEYKKSLQEYDEKNGFAQASIKKKISKTF